MAKNRLIYLPLGGAGEIGMNMYLYGYGAEGRERFILVDMGVTFPDMESSPGVNLIMADPDYIVQRADRLEAIFISHAHEDHIGALALLYPQLLAPVYARAFTAAIARLKLEEHGIDTGVVNEIGAYPETVTAGPFSVSFLPVAHSIPEASGLVIDSPAGRVVHTGDFKLDETPLVGEPYSRALWKEVAKPGVQALVCDSTNVFSPQPGRSEASLPDAITTLIKNADGMVVATTFASNIARLRTLATAGHAAGRTVVVMGRAMKRMLATARGVGVLPDFPPTIEPEDARDIPRNNLMLLVTGSQGERRAAAAQLSNGRFLGMDMREGDLFLFSSKTIPGNETSVSRIINKFSEMGVDVVEDDDRYHVSGHANRPDLHAVHKVIAPKMLVPMHGEHRHLRAHAKLAEDNGISAVVAPNGTMIDLSGKKPNVIEHFETGRRYLDGTIEIGALDGIVRDRIRLARNGHVAVSLLLDEDDEPSGGVWVEPRGLPETGRGGHSVAEMIEEGIEHQIGRAKPGTMMSDAALEKLIISAVRKIGSDLIGKKPECTVMISRLTAAD